MNQALTTGGARALNGNSTAPETIDTTPLWVIVGLAMAPAVAQGLARFSYALLLPSMRADLGWNYADAGAMNTANAAGYLAGALGASTIASRIGTKVAFVIGIFLTALSVAASGSTTNFTALLGLRLVGGFAGAIAFVTGGAIAAAASAGGGKSRAPTILGIYFGGGGIGVLISALIIPQLLHTVGWRGGWVALGATAFGAGVLAMPALRRAPLPAPKPSGSHAGSYSIRVMALTLISYTLYGAGYIAYATFIVALLKSSQHFTSNEISIFWALLGASAMVGAFVWGPPLARLRGGWGTAATIAVVTVGAALPLIWNGRPAAYLSAILFGGSFLAVIAAVTSFVRRAAPPHAWTAAIGLLTTVFGIGQCIGPVLSGALSDGPEGVRLGLLMSVGILAFSAATAAFQSEPHKSA